MDNFLRHPNKNKGTTATVQKGSRFTACPVCGTSVAIPLMNHHLDTECLPAEEASPKKRRANSLSENPSTRNKSPRLEQLHQEPLPSRDIGATPRNGPMLSLNHSGKRLLDILGSPSEEKHTIDIPGSTLLGNTAVLSSTNTPSFRFPAVNSVSEMSSLEAIPHASLPGLWLIENFLSETEETELLHFLDHDRENPWHFSSFNGAHRGKKWGIRTDLRARKFLEAEHLLPTWLQPVIARMQHVGATPRKGRNGCPPLHDFAPNEANAIDYQKALGHLLAPHCDDRQLSGKVLVNLCMAGDSIMTYTRDSKKPSTGTRGVFGGRASTEHAQETYRVLLPRRSLQVQSGTVRYDYRHGISNEDLLHDRRVSITFRQNAAAAMRSLS